MQNIETKTMTGMFIFILLFEELGSSYFILSLKIFVFFSVIEQSCLSMRM